MTPALPRRATALTAVVAALYLLVLWRRPGGDGFMTAFGDLVLAGPALVAAAAAGRTAHRQTGSARWGWALIGAGTTSWAAGQLTWSFYELVAGRATPYPSLADAGYLAFLPLAVLGMALLITGRRGTWRTLLDVLVISGSLTCVSWAFVIGPIVGAGNRTMLLWVVALAYPIGDIAMVTMAVLLLGYVRRTMRTSVVLLASGAASLSVAHGFYAYLIIEDRYAAGTVVDFGWFAGFLLMGLAALAAPRGGRPTPLSPAWTMLPYVPLAVGVTSSIVLTLRHDPRADTTLYLLTMGLVLLVVLRQLVNVRDNLLLTGRLETTLDELRSREAELEHLAFHDPLTGLANRALFQDRAEHAIAHQDRYHEPLALIYLDLDGFKQVNDELGHAVGDALLVEAAARLTTCVRTSDTLARLGGDEFAILTERMRTGDDITVVLNRILESLAEPFHLSGHEVTISGSVGVVLREPGIHSYDDVLRCADEAMYRAKRSGKGRYAVAGA